MGATCGGGQYERSRTIIVEAKGTGKPCSGSLSMVDACNTWPCPLAPGSDDCQWGSWQSWGACDKCGGQRKRFRHIKVMAQNGGRECLPQASEEIAACPRSCHTRVFCTWGEWSEETPCSVTCGIGFVKRVRHLMKSDHPPKAVNLYQDAPKYAESEIQGGHRFREIVTSFACGGLFTFIAAWGRHIFRRAPQASSRTWRPGAFAANAETWLDGNSDEDMEESSRGLLE